MNLKHNAEAICPLRLLELPANSLKIQKDKKVLQEKMQLE